MTLSDDQRPRPSAEIEDHFGWPRGQLRWWRHRGIGPPVYARPTSRRFLYRIVDVTMWLIATAPTKEKA